MNDLKSYIRDIPNFPKQGIIFKDITTLLKDGKKFSQAIDLIAQEFKDKPSQVEGTSEVSRGFFRSDKILIIG